VKVTIPCDDVLRWTAALQAQASQSKDPETQFLANPAFHVAWNDTDRAVTLTSKWLTYAAETSPVEPPNESVVRRYRNFADWYARLNGMRLGNMPPFARMQLNAELEQKGIVPGVVTKTVTPRGVLAKPVEVSSKHLFTWKINPSDEKRINEANNHLVSFKDVTIEQYLDWQKRVANQQ
jgi:hypothetical protein